jgi:hypothetical protein
MNTRAIINTRPCGVNVGSPEAAQDVPAWGWRGARIAAATPTARSTPSTLIQQEDECALNCPRPRERRSTETRLQAQA